MPFDPGRMAGPTAVSESITGGRRGTAPIPPDLQLQVDATDRHSLQQGTCDVGTIASPCMLGSPSTPAPPSLPLLPPAKPSAAMRPSAAPFFPASISRPVTPSAREPAHLASSPFSSSAPTTPLVSQQPTARFSFSASVSNSGTTNVLPAAADLGSSLASLF